MDQKVANPARVSGTGEKKKSLYPITPGNSFLARRVRPSRSASACSLFFTLKLHLVDFARFPRRRPFSYLYRDMTSSQSQVFRVTQIGTQLFMYCVAMAFTTNSQYVRKIRNIFSDKESVVFRNFGGNHHRLRPFTVNCNGRLKRTVKVKKK